MRIFVVFEWLRSRSRKRPADQSFRMALGGRHFRSRRMTSLPPAVVGLGSRTSHMYTYYFPLDICFPDTWIPFPRRTHRAAVVFLFSTKTRDKHLFRSMFNWEHWNDSVEEKRKNKISIPHASFNNKKIQKAFYVKILCHDM